jgi:hypothetical protein
MSKLGLVLVMVLMLGRTNAQSYAAPTSEPLTYFVLIQADDGQAFYIRLDNQLYSSSPAGHLILARLKDSVYTITVGFPGQTYPEQKYLLNIHQKDWALRLTRQDNRWGLFDGQGQAIAPVADPSTSEKPMLAATKKDDAFSQLMSAIVQDTAVMYNTYAAPTDSTQPAALVSSATSAPATTATTTTPITRDSSGSPHSPTDTLSSHPAAPLSVTAAPLSVTAAPLSVTAAPLSVTIDPAIPSAPTGVVKLSEHRSTQSLSLVYADHPADQKTDTIDVVIPVDSQTSAIALVQSSDTSHSTATRHSQTIDTPRSTPGRPPQSDSQTPPTTVNKSSAIFVNSDCHAFATTYDVDKLRVRMLSASKDDDRTQTAYKVFKTKCFTTKQIRALSEVFATDAAKFKFLATAYPFVSDDDFPELVNLLSDPVYTGRFRTMTDRH